RERKNRANARLSGLRWPLGKDSSRISVSPQELTVSTSVYDCPQCGAPVKFQSSIAIFAVCEHCRSMVVRKDLSVESIGVMAELPPDLSPLQIGSRGEWNGKAFELVGRIRVEWDLGSWNEWYALFDGGVGGWVAETQGFYLVSFEPKD